MNPTKILLTVGVAALLTGLPSSASGAFIQNGDFESLDPGAPLFDSWTNNAGVSLAAQAISGSNSARIALNTGNAGNALNQTVNDPGGTLSVFDLSFDFATSNPGGTTARSMQLSLRTVVGSNSGNINMRVVNGSIAGMGHVQVFDGSAFQTVLADVVNFSTSESGAGFIANRARFAGDFSGTTPFYAITVNGTSSANLSHFQGGAPAQGAPLREISFQSGNIAAGAWSVLDNVVVVPEPGTLAMLGVGASLWLASMNRRTDNR